jgi:diaminopimelate epimerase
MLMYEKGIYRRNEMDIETIGGIKHVSLETAEGHVTNVTADIGSPAFECAEIPVSFYRDRLVAENLEIEGRSFVATAVNLGNPHLVLFSDDVDEIDLKIYGRAAENLDIFPERTNVEFCRFNSSKSARLRTWERGTGETAACATGCCACLCAGVLEGICDREITVHQNGGKTRVEWDDNGHLHMTAPSRIVFEGQIMLDEKYFGEGER